MKPTADQHRLAVGAAAGGITAWTAPLLVLSAVGGMALGTVLAKACVAVIARVEDGAAADVLGFLAAFGVWLLADRLGLSAVLAMVAFAMTLARTAPQRMGVRRRRASYAVWGVAVFVLNVLAFILVGLQLRGILARLDGMAGHYALFALAVLATIVLVRLVWAMGYYAMAQWKDRRFGVSVVPRPLSPRSLGGGIVIAWCGMRGIVTLAAALALPVGFPGRDLILLASFCMVLGTLVAQGLTLRPLLSRLVLLSDESVEEEVAVARAEAARAALDALSAPADAGGDGEARHLLEREYRARLKASTLPGGMATDPTGLGALRRRALAAERVRLAALRREERIGDDAFHRVEEELDCAEAEVDGSGR